MQDIKHKMNQLGICVTDMQTQQLNDYYKLLVEKNKVMNLTAITEYDEVVIKHFVDSAAIVKALDLSKIKNVIDVGTGAGFPGMVLKIIFPELKVTLLDSLNKRINFLNDVIDKLELNNVEAVHGRAEDAAHNKGYREKYDLVVARAVTNMSSLSEYCIPFAKVGGKFIAYKSDDCRDEVAQAGNAIKILGGDAPEVVKFTIPDTDITRSFVCVDKIRNSLTKYPRKAGLQTKEPIV